MNLNLSTNALENLFPKQCISRFGDVAGPAESPGLNPGDFRLWGCLKVAEFAAKPNTVVELKNYIRNKVIEIPVSTICRVKANFFKRLRTYVVIDLGHLSVFIFHK